VEKATVICVLVLDTRTHADRDKLIFRDSVSETVTVEDTAGQCDNKGAQNSLCSEESQTLR